MSKILKYALLALVVYVVVTEAPGWIDKISNLGEGLSRKSGPVSETRCIGAAEDASESFGREMRDFSSPPIDLDAWDVLMEDLRERIYRAQSRCDCPRDSCQKATQALAELTLLVEDFDGSLRGTGMPLNPARRQETIDKMLKRARELDRQGS